MRKPVQLASSVVFVLGCGQEEGPKAPETADLASASKQVVSRNPHVDWDAVHAGRVAIEGGHQETGHTPTVELELGGAMPDLEGRVRPELHLYTYEENGVEKRRFRARLHSGDNHSLVVRVDPSSPELGVPGLGDPANGLHVMPNGEILIKTQDNAAVRFEFRVDNPGDGLADYKC